MLNADMAKYEDLDSNIIKYTLKAEKKCRKLYMGGVPYSPELVTHLNLIKFWRILIREKKVVAQICARLFAYKAPVVLEDDRWMPILDRYINNISRLYLPSVS
mmetsp:Transcript_9843/g.11518  ORF Transcript_9843/g.11518 Transcript_9843/m.11518 type:complete len:103 (+) Transcript_9843:22-330(+)